MAADDVKITTPVKIESSSKEHVALLLMDKIVYYDTRAKNEITDRKYLLTLYRQCLKATSNYPLESILKEE